MALTDTSSRSGLQTGVQVSTSKQGQDEQPSTCLRLIPCSIRSHHYSTRSHPGKYTVNSLVVSWVQDCRAPLRRPSPTTKGRLDRTGQTVPMFPTSLLRCATLATCITPLRVGATPNTSHTWREATMAPFLVALPSRHRLTSLINPCTRILGLWAMNIRRSLKAI